MDPQIGQTIIGGLALIISTVLIVYKETIRDSLARQARDWSGAWTGTGTANDPLATYQITAVLTQHGRRVTGILTTHSPEHLHYEIEGRITEDEYLQYTARNSDKDKINYLAGVNRWSRDGERMVGAYVARSRLVDGVRTGTIDLRRASLSRKKTR